MSLPKSRCNVDKNPNSPKPRPAMPFESGGAEKYAHYVARFLLAQQWFCEQRQTIPDSLIIAICQVCLQPIVDIVSFETCSRDKPPASTAISPANTLATTAKRECQKAFIQVGQRGALQWTVILLNYSTE